MDGSLLPIKNIMKILAFRLEEFDKTYQKYMITWTSRLAHNDLFDSLTLDLKTQINNSLTNQHNKLVV